MIGTVVPESDEMFPLNPPRKAAISFSRTPTMADDPADDPALRNSPETSLHVAQLFGGNGLFSDSSLETVSNIREFKPFLMVVGRRNFYMREPRGNGRRAKTRMDSCTLNKLSSRCHIWIRER